MGYSAKRLGEKIGLTSEQMNVLLKEEGYLEGDAGNYRTTEKAKEYTELKSWDNGYGGYASRGYDYYEYDEKILENIDTSEERLEEIRILTSQRRIERKVLREQSYKEREKERMCNEKIEQENNIGEELVIFAGICLVIGIGIVGIYKYLKNKAKATNIDKEKNKVL